MITALHTDKRTRDIDTNSAIPDITEQNIEISNLYIYVQWEFGQAEWEKRVFRFLWNELMESDQFPYDIGPGKANQISQEWDSKLGGGKQNKKKPPSLDSQWVCEFLFLKDEKNLLKCPCPIQPHPASNGACDPGHHQGETDPASIHFFPLAHRNIIVYVYIHDIQTRAPRERNWVKSYWHKK